MGGFSFTLRPPYRNDLLHRSVCGLTKTTIYEYDQI